MNRRRSATAERAAKATVSRHAALWWPAAIWMLLWTASFGAHVLFTRAFPEYLIWVAVFLTLLVVGMTLVAWHIAKSRRRKTSWDVPFVSATTFVAGMWVVCAMIAGATTPPLLVAYITVGPPAVIVWIMRMVMERKDAETEGSGWQITRGNATENLLASVGIEGHRAQITDSTNANFVDGVVNLVESDQNLADLQAGAGKLAGAAGLPPGAVRFTPTGTAEQYRMRMVLQDTLTKSTRWPGPSHPGGTVFAPYPMGVYEDGPVACKYCGDKAGARNQGVFGMSRSGKGNAAKIEVAEHVTRQEVSVTVIDTVKGILTFGALANSLDWFILDIPTARVLFRRVMHVVKARANYLGAKRIDTWLPGCGLQFWVLQVEEASHLDVPPDDAANLAKACAGVGIRLVWSLQSAQHTEMPVTLRRQLGQLAVYGCNDDFDQSALPDEVTVGGVALPAQWLANFPGKNLLIDKGLPMERQQTPLRDYEIDRAQLEALSREWPAQPLDDVTAAALGDLYINRQRPVDVVAAISAKALGGAPIPSAVQVPQTASATAGGVDDGDDDGDDGIDQAFKQELAMKRTTHDMAPEIEIEREALGRPLPPMQGPDMQIGPPPPPGSEGYVPTEEHTTRIRAIVAERIAEAERAGERHVAPPLFQDLVGPSSPTTRSRGWFRKELDRLEKAGRLKFDPYERKYEIQPDPAGVTAVR